MRRAQHDRGRASIEDAVATSHDSLVVEGITETEARREVIGVTHRRGRIQTGCGQRGARVTDGRIGEILKVVAQSEIERQLRSHTPVVLHEQAILVQIRVRYAA